MRNNSKRTFAAIIALLGAATTAPLATTAALALTEQEEAADCQNDAMRLCSPYVPDRAKIHACLVSYKNYLSPACRAIVAPTKRRAHH